MTGKIVKILSLEGLKRASDNIKEWTQKGLDDKLSLSGGTLTGTLYTEASNPQIIGKNGKIGIRAEGSVDGVTNMGQMTISDSFYGSGTRWACQLSAYDSQSKGYNSFRVSHEGLLYIDSNDVTHDIALVDDLSEYSTKKQVEESLKTKASNSEFKTLQGDVSTLSGVVSGKQDALSPGDNITISEGVISAKDTTYDLVSTSKIGLMSTIDKAYLDNVRDNLIPGLSSGKQDVLTAGTNIQISGSVISTTAEANKIDSITIDGTPQIISGKTVALDLSSYARKSDITAAVKWKGTKSKVSELPTSGRNIGDMWHVEEKSAEYIFNGSGWEEVGSIVDLSAYYTSSQIDSILKNYYTGAEGDAKFAPLSGYNALTNTVSELSTTVDDKVSKIAGKDLSTNDFTDAYKTKLDNIQDEANKVIVDSTVTSTSTNPVESKAIYAELAKKADASSDGTITATVFKGDLEGNASSADSAQTAVTAGSAMKATQDADGNVITEHYVTRDQFEASLSLKADIEDISAYQMICTLPSAGWVSKKQTVPVEGMTPSRVVLVEPLGASGDTWFDCGLYASEQLSGELTFTCEDVPSSDVIFRVVHMHP